MALLIKTKLLKFDEKTRKKIEKFNQLEIS